MTRNRMLFAAAGITAAVAGTYAASYLLPENLQAYGYGIGLLALLLFVGYLYLKG